MIDTDDEDKPRCCCAIFGVFNAPKTDASQLTYYGLHSLQHRGQESAGILAARSGDIRQTTSPTTTSRTSVLDLTSSPTKPQLVSHESIKYNSNALPNDEKYLSTNNVESDTEYEQEPVSMNLYKGFGLVLDVFNDPSLFSSKLLGESAIGHTRYSTTGGDKLRVNIQPFHVKYKNGNLGIVHNGNLTNYKILHKRLEANGTIFQSSSDSELLLHLIAQSKKITQTEQVLDALAQLEGAYCFLILTDRYLFACRDPSGFRPLQLGRLGDIDTRGGATYILSSETCGLDLIDAKFVREIDPGEVLVLTTKSCRMAGKFQSHRIVPIKKQPIAPCVFEFVYFARPDSRIFGQTVDTVRHRTGIRLAQEAPVGNKLTIGVTDSTENPVIVCAVPDSSNTAALGYMKECARMGYNCTFGIAIIRNHYVGRTFISPNQNARELKVRCKFNIVRRVVKDQIVVMVDDSIVRGTTSKQLIAMMRSAGAKEVHFRVASPMVIGPCFYGMDFPTKKELLGHRFNSFDDLAKYLNADSIAYLSVEGMMKAVREGDPRGVGTGDYPHNNDRSPFCGACFTDRLPVPLPDPNLEW